MAIRGIDYIDKNGLVHCIKGYSMISGPWDYKKGASINYCPVFHPFYRIKGLECDLKEICCPQSKYGRVFRLKANNFGKVGKGENVLENEKKSNKDKIEKVQKKLLSLIGKKIIIEDYTECSRRERIIRKKLVAIVKNTYNGFVHVQICYNNKRKEFYLNKCFYFHEIIFGRPNGQILGGKVFFIKESNY